MIEKESVPFAPSLIESMRSIGYSFETALADLLDNSISANAKKIDINLYPDQESIITILDDGKGMTFLELEEAMRYGSKNPLESRNPEDLGRFGLGMKSASLSQCRKLTVFSKKEMKISGFIWDLDFIIKKGKWSLLELSQSEIENNNYSKSLVEYDSGTLLVLEKFDRIKHTTGDLSKTLNEKLSYAIDHLSLVFHRFIEEGLKIYVNNNLIIHRDPFLIKNKGTMPKREQVFRIDNEPIFIKPFILPHVNKLSHDDTVLLGGKDTLRTEQGFYVYRNKRLIVWGTWFNLERKHELNKLARVRVDIPNSLDYVWSVDIKKSTAKLPDIIKKNLHNAVYEAVRASETVHSFRGRTENNSDNNEYVWERIKTRTGYIYKVNRNIPDLIILKKVLSKPDYGMVESLIKFLENSFPVASMYIDYAKGQYNSETENEEDIYELCMDQIRTAEKLDMDMKSLIGAFLYTEPYCNDEKLKYTLKEKLGKYE